MYLNQVKSIGGWLLAAMVSGGSAQTQSNPCTQTSSYARSACRQQASADYFTALGKCENLASDSEKSRCRREAAQARAESLARCDEQYAARNDVCSDLGGAAYDPVIVPADFSTVIDNPYFPLTPGTTFVYECACADGVEHVEVEVTGETREILGVACVKVHDIVLLNGAVLEDTFDFFAQDSAGNVWYFGESTQEYENGLVSSIAGSWLAGIEGAKPGIIAPAQPIVEQVYRQEFLLGEAEDLAEPISLSATASVPYGTFSACLETEEFTPIEPDHLEQKFYAPGIGQVLTIDTTNGDRTELVEIRVN